jgi:hypothetical protein
MKTQQQIKASVRRRLRAVGLATALLLACSTQAASLDLVGVKIADTVDVANNRLTLNGAGIRYKGPFKVYTAAMYLPSTTNTADAAMSMPGAKRMALTLVREVDSGELGRLFMRSIEDNTPKSELVKILGPISKMGDVFAEAKRVVPGDTIAMDWIPGTGSVVSIRGKVVATFKEPEFYRALMGMWLGKSPSDWMLKDALLSVGKTNN